MFNENLTEKTLADVQAGIPARDAEIEALRKENAELREQLEAIGAGWVNGKLMPGAVSAEQMIEATVCGYTPGQSLVELRLPAGWRLRGLALELGDAVIISAAPVAAQAQPLDIQLIEITDSMALAFHNAITDGSVGQEDVDDIKTGLRAAFANILDMRPQAQQPVSGADGLTMSEAPWSGWACQYPGKLPRLYGAKDIAVANHHPEEGDRLIFLTAQQDAETGKSVSVENQGVTQQDAEKVDAERYRWLREKRTREELQIVLCDEGGELDAAIDAARKEQA